MLYFFSCLLPASHSAGTDRTRVTGVQLGYHQRVGNYDISILRADSAASLSNWLGARSLVPLSPAAKDIIDDYITRKWCFMVAHLRHDGGGSATPHPIAATFPSPQPIFPMKLTALAGSRTQVELFVISDKAAIADRFDVVATDAFSASPPWHLNDFVAAPHYAAAKTDLVIGHPDVAALMWEGCTGTHLSAWLTPAAMDRDITITMTQTEPYRRTVYSERGRRETSLIILVLAGCVLVVPSAIIFRNGFRVRGKKLYGLIAGVIAMGLVTGGFYMLAPTIPVRVGQGIHSRLQGMFLSRLLGVAQEFNHERWPRMPATSAEWAALPKQLGELDKGDNVLHLNPFTGNERHYERSPGNFSSRVVEGKTYFCVYDREAREYRVPIPPPSTRPAK